MIDPSIDGLIERFLLELMACNAEDSGACGMIGSQEMRAAFRTALGNYNLHCPDGDPARFMAFFEFACLGDRDRPLAPLRPEAPPLTAFVSTEIEPKVLSTVVTLPQFLSLISEDDKQNFEQLYDIRLLSSGSNMGADFLQRMEPKLLDRLRSIPELDRNFKISDDRSHGRPFVWFTAKQDLDDAFADAGRRSLNRADVARDFLGLVHHGPKLYERGRLTDCQNHLVALHFPSEIAEREGFMRPSAVQAFVHRRFAVHFERPIETTSQDWGNAIDLWSLLTRRGVPPMGGRERIMLRLQASVMTEDERIAFDYLGPVQLQRGNVDKHDDDEYFLQFVSRGRDKGSLAEGICN